MSGSLKAALGRALAPLRSKLCPNCKSPNIRGRADVVWNEDRQRWEMEGGGGVDECYCRDCFHGFDVPITSEVEDLTR